jgi:hypothetical protein
MVSRRVEPFSRVPISTAERLPSYPHSNGFSRVGLSHALVLRLTCAHLIHQSSLRFTVAPQLLAVMAPRLLTEIAPRGRSCDMLLTLAVTFIHQSSLRFTVAPRLLAVLAPQLLRLFQLLAILAPQLICLFQLLALVAIQLIRN